MPFPDELDNFSDPQSSDKLNSPRHSSLHRAINAAVKAAESKIGTGSSLPIANSFFIGNGAGTSAWSQLTSAELAARITDETGSGSLVFGTSPSFTTSILPISNNAVDMGTSSLHFRDVWLTGGVKFGTGSTNIVSTSGGTGITLQASSSSTGIILISPGNNSGSAVSTTASQTLTNKTLTTPTIASFTNATHDHTNAAGGGALGANTVDTTQIKDEAVTAAKTDFGGAWDTYTPTWSTGGTQPSLGNGTLVGRYKQIGKVIFVTIKLTFGSTTSFGSGVCLFSLPVTPKSDGSDGAKAGGTVDLTDAGVSSYFGISRVIESGASSTYRNKLQLLCPSSTTAGASIGVDATHPFTWGVGDTINATVTYEAS